ncbi:MAG: hypothetical protein U9R66_14160 [Thermodesulfobacteriota bacterium]|nr:hypothetical protein [Thermodesulfobacteriota bacterium]
MKHCRPLKSNFRPFILLLSCVGLLTSGCVDKSLFNTYPHYYLSVESENIEPEIVRLEKVIADEPDPETAAESFYYLSLLYSHHKKRQPNYPKALQNLESYIRLNPEAGKKNDVQYLLSLFREIETIGAKNHALKAKNNALKKDRARLKSDTSTLKKEREQLTADNQNLQNIIEQLKLLDIQLEERRKSVTIQ